MGKRIINCSVKDEYLLGSGVPVGAAGSHNDVAIRVEFNEQWYGLNIYAIWRDSFGANPVLIPLTPDMLFKPMVYDIPVAAAAKKYAGRIFLTLSGYSIVDGSEEETATVTNEAYFRVLPSGYKILEDGSIEPTVAQRLLDAINKLDENKVSKKELENVIDEAITESLNIAKESGEFKGDKGDPGEKGDPYVLTEADKKELVSSLLAALPEWNGGSY